MNSFPNMIVTAPKDGNELRNLLATALKANMSFSIRYPKSDSLFFDINKNPEILQIGEWEILHSGIDVAILAVGSMVDLVLSAKDYIYKQLGYLPTIINARFIKPLDSKILCKICKNHSAIITIEEGTLIGGFGSAVGNYLHDNNIDIKLKRMGIPDQYVPHGERQDLLNEIGLNPHSIVEYMLNLKSKNIYEF